jgi:glycosyltransferase involved in cell wall biosynthesis
MRKEKQNILLITDYFYPHWTGYAKSLFYLVESLSKLNNITVLTVRHDKSLKRCEKILGADVVREDYILSISRSKYSLKIIFKFFQLVSRYDAVFINSPCSNILFLSIITKMFGKRLYIFHQGDLILPKKILNKLIEKIFDLSSFISFSIADKVSTYTRDYANHSRILKHFLYKFSPMIPPINPIYLNQKKQSSKKIDKNSRVLFGFAGRFVHEKGFDVLFSAIPLIKKEIPNAYFIFAGEINMGYEDFYKKNLVLFDTVKKDVTILDLLDDAKLKEFYEKIDFIIVPSRSDCFNLVQAEAMLSGVPSIASDIPGLRIPVKETGFGVLFKKEDPQDLTRAVIEAVKNWEQIIKKEINVKVVFDKQSNLTKLRTFFS